MFSIKDIKAGMLVKYRDGSLRKVHPDYEEKEGKMLLSNPSSGADGGWTQLSNFDNELLNKGNRSMDIMAVYVPVSNYKYCSLCLHDHNVIWERDKELEVTLSEIAEKFGVNVYNLKIVAESEE